MSKRTISVNWDEAEGAKYIREPGEYIVKLVEAEFEKDEEKPYIEWKVKCTEGKSREATISFKTFITPKALWKLREFLDAIDYPVSGSVQELDLDDIIEKAKPFVIEVEEGRERQDGKGYYMQVSDYMGLDNYKETTTSPKSDDKKELNIIEALEDEIDELGLDIDLDDYDTLEEKKEAVEKAKAKMKKGIEPMVGPVKYTAEMLADLGSKELDKLAEEIGLEFEEDSSPRSKRRSLAKALKEEGRFEE